jgi:hypothetical protein
VVSENSMDASQPQKISLDKLGGPGLHKVDDVAVEPMIGRYWHN